MEPGPLIAPVTDLRNAGGGRAGEHGLPDNVQDNTQDNREDRVLESLEDCLASRGARV